MTVCFYPSHGTVWTYRAVANFQIGVLGTELGSRGRKSFSVVWVTVSEYLPPGSLRLFICPEDFETLGEAHHHVSAGIPLIGEHPPCQCRQTKPLFALAKVLFGLLTLRDVYRQPKQALGFPVRGVEEPTSRAQPASCPIPPNNTKFLGELLVFVSGYSKCMLQMFAVILMYTIPRFFKRSRCLIGCHSKLGVRLPEPDFLTSLEVVIPTSD
ncbi:MAG TPA: hypothetical protein VEI52_07845 [Terriglobales bacterium]|nr:hypothetical protein [Terriglobales bacterium]